MIRTAPAHVWAFDLEWVPDTASGRRAYNLPPDTPDADVFAAMWAHGGATEQEPRPYLKTMLCRVVAVAVVVRKVQADGQVFLGLTSLPHEGEEGLSERQLLDRFLTSLGTANPKPALVGFNSRDSDLPILIQRGIAQGVSAPGFCHRPEKNWEGYDYFAKYNEGHVDLKEVISGGWGKSVPRLHDFAAACGVPGKIDTSGDNVLDLWLAGNTRAIVQYNEFDALTTYLLWLRTAHFAGHFTDEAHAAELTRVRDLLRKRIANGQTHLRRYVDKWDALAAIDH